MDNPGTDSEGDHRKKGIGLMETLLKVVEVLIDTCIHASLQMHNFLHGRRSGRGTGRAIMELKLAKELGRIYYDPLFLVFLDLWKVYDTVDRDFLIRTLEGYGAGPRMCGILETFGEYQQVVLSQNGFHGPALPSTRGTMQGRLVSPTLFNVMV